VSPGSAQHRVSVAAFPFEPCQRLAPEDRVVGASRARVTLRLVADELDGYLDSRGARLPLDDIVYGGVDGLWLLIFCSRAAYLISKNWFEAADGHLLLPPRIGPWMAWLVAIVSLIGNAGGPPRPANLIFTFGGARSDNSARRTRRRPGHPPVRG
jgi:hypothetical protein